MDNPRSETQESSNEALALSIGKMLRTVDLLFTGWIHIPSPNEEVDLAVFPA
jgi:hypothetical protein